MNQTEQTTIIGIDCATNDEKVGLSISDASPDQCVTRFARVSSSERGVAEEVAACLVSPIRTLIALDAPLGWPRPMSESLAAHKAGEPLAVAANDLFRRATDRFVKSRLGKQSLDVGADRIARTAHSALKLLAAFDFLRGNAEPPDDIGLARHAGWIWVLTRLHATEEQNG